MLQSEHWQAVGPVRSHSTSDMMLRLWTALGAIEDNGKISSSRIRGIWWDCIVAGLLISIIWHMIHLSDGTRLSIWISNLPIIIFSLIALANSPYGINQAGSAVSALADVLKKKD